MRRRLPATAAVVLALTALTGCGSGSSPSPAPTSSATVHEVPGAHATVVVPAGWTSTVQGTDDGQELIARAPGATGDPDFRANVVVTAAKAGRSLDEEGAAALASADALPGWTAAADGGGPTTVAGLPAFQVAGTFDSAGVVATQTETIVELAGDTPVFVYVTMSVPTPGGHATEADTQAVADAATAARSVLDSLTPTP